MNRKEALKLLAVIGTGTLLFPYCNSKKDTTTIFNAKQQKIIDSVCDALIPATSSFMGAKDIQAQDFVMKMLNDCTAPDKQHFYTFGISEFDELCNKKFKANFDKCTASQKKELFAELELEAKDDKNAAAQFYKTTKKYTVQAFTTCKNYMLDIKKYQLVPGSKFKGKVKIVA
jgi:hypothetical protein